MLTFNQLLAEYRQKAFSERDKGTRFENLMQGFMQTYPAYRGRFAKVWLWNEFPFRGDFGGKDTGIDLVAKTVEGDYWAVQCKCYQEKARIDKPAVDSFLSTSSKTFADEQGQIHSFAQRLWISTTNNWNSEAENTIKNQNPPVARISLTDLQTAAIDWEKLNNGIFGEGAIKKDRQPRDHQKKAMKLAAEHYAQNTRGKMIMACGTGKTFTSLKIAEQQTNGHGLILFLVPSIALLGQTLNEWSTFAKKPLNAICVCSDATASNRKQDDNDELKSVDLALPATTDVAKIAQRLREAMRISTVKPEETGMTVVFSTYQSIEVVAKAQKKILAMSTPEEKESFIFDYIICDEAHRTTGVEDKTKGESPFLMVHKDENVQGRHRLYMTATPRLYTADSKKKAADGGVEICSMDDPDIYGEEFYRIGFGEAVEKDLLADYKVLVLTIGDDQIPARLQEAIADPNQQIQTDDASKLIGCINALSKRMVGDDDYLKEVDPQPMHTALAFCSRISDSKQITGILNQYKDAYYESLDDDQRAETVNIAARHVDGSMGAAKRDEELAWLKDTPRDGMDCRVITNVRCLSEGVDVPALDAVLFLSARKSQVDVVQSVGRVMRVAHASGKKYGYIIIPIIVPINKTPEEALDEDKNFDVVWSVLNALRAHDDRFNAEINKIELNKGKSKRIIVGRVGENDGGNGDNGGHGVNEDPAAYIQQNLHFDELQGAIYARMVKKVGSRHYWEQWAKDIADIAARHKARIEKLIQTDADHKKAFQKFMQGLRKNLNPSLGDEDAIEMLSQHIITRPVFEALFENYDFVKNNTVSQSMQKILDLLDEDGMDKDQAQLEKFYASVKQRCEGVDNAEGKQKIITELYEKFFKVALPKTVGKLGIVYTPVEIVDFILHSVNDVLKKEFNRSLSDENVHILDPFTGTGTFITRLLQSGIIKEKDLIRKYTKELHANEIVLLAYYIASINIENAFHDLMKGDDYTSFDGICLTDTFQLGEDSAKGESMFTDVFPQNSIRVLNQQHTPLRVIIGNPPYSVGQTSANDNAQNERYPHLEGRIASTYVDKVNATNKNAIYDSYIKAFRWASDRLDGDNGGVIGFVTNSGWIDKDVFSGLRQCFEEEFTSIYIFDLQGDIRGKIGESARRAGANVFNIIAGVAITILVKNPKQKKDKADIFYHNIGDFLGREEKKAIIADFKSCMSRKFSDALKVLRPNKYNDWLNQRNSIFEDFIPIGDKKNKTSKVKVFCDFYGRGIATARDTWIYNFSQPAVKQNMQVTINFYNEELDNLLLDESYEPIRDSHKITWARSTLQCLHRHMRLEYDDKLLTEAMHRPFCKQHLLNYSPLIDMTYQMPKLFPTRTVENLLICVSGVGARREHSVYITDKIADLHIFDAGTQCFPLYYYEEKETTQGNLFDQGQDKYIRRDGITDFIYGQAKKLYGDKVTKEDIFFYVYGFLHLPKYRAEFAADLKKSLPRIMLVKTPKVFWQISKAGRALADIHLHYEDQPHTAGVVVEGAEKGNFTVTKLKFKSKDDKSTLIYNKDITIKNIPDAAHTYIVNGRSPLEWIIDRYQVKTDKNSGILNDCNKWGEEHGNPRYILDLILSCITVSIKTQEIVDSLPDVTFS